MFYAIYTECKNRFAIAALFKGKDSCSIQNLAGRDDGKDLLSPVVQESSGTNDLVDCFVFQDENHALHFMENFPIAHMKIFYNIIEARAFVILGPDRTSSELEVQPVNFFEPSFGELKSLRNHIKDGEYENVKSMIRDNPKTLISFGGIATNLLSCSNYNAVHICAQYNQPKIAELILHTICSHRFANLYLDRMSPTMHNYETLSKKFLEVFLNTPDNILGETPLHIAAKFGHVEVVKVLTLFSACKSQTNFDGHLPVDIICKSAKGSTTDVFRKIKQLLMESYQAPILSTSYEMPSQDIGDDPNSDPDENISPAKEVPSSNHRKQLTRSSFISPFSPNEDREKSQKVRRSLFSPKSDDKSFQSSYQVSPEPSAEVNQHDGGVQLEMIKLSSTPLQHTKDSSSFVTMASPMIPKLDITLPAPLDLAPDLNNPCDFSSTSLAVNVSCPNPWVCIESSLQENINVIAKLIIRKLQDLSSSNSLLLIEMNRLEALIYNFQKDEHFSEVAFEKIHSRVSTLLITAMEKSQDITDIKANIENHIYDVFTQSPGLHCGFTKCISAHLLKKLTELPRSHQNYMKNEKLFAIVMWMEERTCYCVRKDNIYFSDILTELQNVRKPLNEDTTDDFKELVILNNESTKTDIQVDDEKQEVPRDMKNVVVPVEDKCETHCETFIDNAKADELIHAIATSPISIQISINSKSTPSKIPKSDKPFAQSTPEKKSNGLFSTMCQQKLDCGEKDNSLEETKDVCPVTSAVIFTTPDSKQPGLFSKYREKSESDNDDTFLGNDTSQLSDESMI